MDLILIPVDIFDMIFEHLLVRDIVTFYLLDKDLIGQTKFGQEMRRVDFTDKSMTLMDQCYRLGLVKILTQVIKYSKKRLDIYRLMDVCKYEHLPILDLITKHTRPRKIVANRQNRKLNRLIMLKSVKDMINSSQILVNWFNSRFSRGKRDRFGFRDSNQPVRKGQCYWLSSNDLEESQFDWCRSLEDLFLDDSFVESIKLRKNQLFFLRGITKENSSIYAVEQLDWLWKHCRYVLEDLSYKQTIMIKKAAGNTQQINEWFNNHEFNYQKIIDIEIPNQPTATQKFSIMVRTDNPYYFKGFDPRELSEQFVRGALTNNSINCILWILKEYDLSEDDLQFIFRSCEFGSVSDKGYCTDGSDSSVANRSKLLSVAVLEKLLEYSRNAKLSFDGWIKLSSDDPAEFDSLLELVSKRGFQDKVSKLSTGKFANALATGNVSLMAILLKHRIVVADEPTKTKKRKKPSLEFTAATIKSIIWMFENNFHLFIHKSSWILDNVHLIDRTDYRIIKRYSKSFIGIGQNMSLHSVLIAWNKKMQRLKSGYYESEEYLKKMATPYRLRPRKCNSRNKYNSEDEQNSENDDFY